MDRDIGRRGSQLDLRPSAHRLYAVVLREHVVARRRLTSASGSEAADLLGEVAGGTARNQVVNEPSAHKDEHSLPSVNLNLSAMASEAGRSVSETVAILGDPPAVRTLALQLGDDPGLTT